MECATHQTSNLVPPRSASYARVNQSRHRRRASRPYAILRNEELSRPARRNCDTISSQRGLTVSDWKLPGGTFGMAPDLVVTRMGYGAMQLAGPGVLGPPKDRDEAIAVLREVVESGITHIDTSDYYGPYVTNELIREALYPYPESPHLVTKVGGRRDAT